MVRYKSVIDRHPARSGSPSAGPINHCVNDSSSKRRFVTGLLPQMKITPSVINFRSEPFFARLTTVAHNFNENTGAVPFAASRHDISSGIQGRFD